MNYENSKSTSILILAYSNQENKYGFFPLKLNKKKGYVHSKQNVERWSMTLSKQNYWRWLFPFFVTRFCVHQFNF